MPSAAALRGEAMLYATGDLTHPISPWGGRRSRPPPPAVRSSSSPPYDKFEFSAVAILLSGEKNAPIDARSRKLMEDPR